eukprot:6202359-Pleurochrysis_carterae.AAC.4
MAPSCRLLSRGSGCRVAAPRRTSRVSSSTDYAVGFGYLDTLFSHLSTNYLRILLLFISHPLAEREISRLDARRLQVRVQASQHDAASLYEELLRVNCCVTNESYFDSMPNADFAAIIWRPNVSSQFVQAVIQRTALAVFKVYSKTEWDEFKTYAHGENEDGLTINDSVVE